jgi:two-component system LytT family response regulator
MVPTPVPSVADPRRRLRVVIVDDEPLARDKLRRYLAEDERVRVVAEAGDGLAAIEAIEAERPDLVLLDVQMPEMDGFEVVTALDVAPLPRFVFVTAHDEHAVRAFEVRALDYLLKPVDRARLTEAVGRAASVDGDEPPDARRLLEDAPDTNRPLTRFLVRSRGRMQLVPIREVDWIGAAGNYVELHVGDRSHLVRGTLQSLEGRLPAEAFVRIHRSTIVNLDRIRALHPWSHGDLQVVLADGTELRMSRRYRDRLEAMFGP